MEGIQNRKYTVEEFEALPEDERYELINGELYAMAAPEWIHQELVAGLVNEIKNYIRSKKGDCRVLPAPFDVRLFAEEDTIVEPDITVICERDKISKKGCTGAPDWIIEIVSPSNSAHDYIDKLKLYHDAGVREYWIIDPEIGRVTVYNMEQTIAMDNYTLKDTVKAGIYEDLSIDFDEMMKEIEG
ncbi:MAG: Uma2 family endonuclease [Lachnospiraceae bacterium]|nr:Uma2 family endonuclease [Lachnospiraceae bacterium]